jgi:hypothetical protein
MDVEPLRKEKNKLAILAEPLPHAKYLIDPLWRGIQLGIPHRLTP